MRSEIIKTAWIFCLLASITCSTASGDKKTHTPQKDSTLLIYLPRQVTIKNDTITLGQVSIFRGDDTLEAMADKIALGRICVPGQVIVMDRETILSRLACNGIPASKVTLSGAEKITIRRQQRIIKGSEFVKLANSFLKKSLSGGPACRWDPIRKPKDLVIPGENKDIKLSPRLAKNSAKNQAKVQIAALADGKQIAIREVTFRLKYNGHRVVTLMDIPAGATISPENVKIENTISDYPEPAHWKPPYGLVAKCRLPAKTVIEPHMLRSTKTTVIVKRNQNVVIQVERPGLLITAIAKATQDGRAGEYIKVRNLDSQRIILVKVNEDGTVRPAF